MIYSRNKRTEYIWVRRVEQK